MGSEDTIMEAGTGAFIASLIAGGFTIWKCYDPFRWRKLKEEKFFKVYKPLFEAYKPFLFHVEKTKGSIQFIKAKQLSEKILRERLEMCGLDFEITYNNYTQTRTPKQKKKTFNALSDYILRGYSHYSYACGYNKVRLNIRKKYKWFTSPIQYVLLQVDAIINVLAITSLVIFSALTVLLVISKVLDLLILWAQS